MVGSKHAGVSRVMSLRSSSSVYPTASLAAVCAIGKAVALEASAELRDTRGFISITTSRPVWGWTANWMFDPPVSTPMARMIFTAASRMSWYSLSVSVCAGATVMESPVCTPIGSKFSIEHTMTTLSLPSRITSSSNSFQPAMDSSMRISLIGDAPSPQTTWARNSSSVCAKLPPVPPSVREGRRMAGSPTSARTRSASSSVWAMPLRGRSRPMPRIVSLKRSRSSARLMAATFAPVSSTPERARNPPPAEASRPPRLGEVEREIEPRLSADRGQQRVRPLGLDDARQHLDRERLDVRPVGELRIGHDGRRIRVGEDDPVALLLERLARLGTGVVELAGLADDDGPGADQQDGADVGALRHRWSPGGERRAHRPGSIISTRRRNR